MVLGVTPAAGTQANGIWGFESTFGSASSSMDKVFGHDFKITDLTFNRNNERFSGLGNVEHTKNVNKLFSGKFGCEFVLGNGWFWRLLTGNTSVDAGSGPYTHTFLNTSATPATVAKQAPSFSLYNSIDLDNDFRGKYLGCKFQSASITASVNELVRVKAEVEFADLAKDATLSTLIADSWADPFAFSHGTLQIPTSTTLAEVQSFELSIKRNAEYLSGLGNFKPTKAVNKLIEYDGKLSLLYEDPASILDRFMGSTTALVNQQTGVTLDLTFDNGLSTTNLRKHQVAFSGAKFDNYMLPQSVTDVIKEDVAVQPTTWTTCVYTDNTAVAL